MKKHQQKTSYTPEFKVEAIKLVIDNNLTLVDAAKRLGMPMKTLSAWVARVRRGGTPQMKSIQSDDHSKAEIARLKKVLAVAEMERDILKKGCSR